MAHAPSGLRFVVAYAARSRTTSRSSCSIDRRAGSGPPSSAAPAACACARQRPSSRWAAGHASSSASRSSSAAVEQPRARSPQPHPVHRHVDVVAAARGVQAARHRRRRSVLDDQLARRRRTGPRRCRRSWRAGRRASSMAVEGDAQRRARRRATRCPARSSMTRWARSGWPSAARGTAPWRPRRFSFRTRRTYSGAKGTGQILSGGAPCTVQGCEVPCQGPRVLVRGCQGAGARVRVPGASVLVRSVRCQVLVVLAWHAACCSDSHGRAPISGSRGLAALYGAP